MVGAENSSRLKNFPASPFRKHVCDDQVLQFLDGARLTVAIFRLVLEHIIRSVGGKVFAFVNHLLGDIVIEPDIYPERYPIGFHLGSARVVFGLVRVAQERHLEIRIGFFVYQPNPSRVFPEKVHDAVPERISKYRIERLVIDFVNLHSPNMAGKRTRRKAVAADKAKCGSHQEKKHF